MSDDPLELDPERRLEIERLRRKLERHAASYEDRKRGSGDRSTEESLDELLASPPSSRKSLIKRDERNIGRDLSGVMLDQDERGAKALARLVAEGAISLDGAVRRHLGAATIDRFVDDYYARIPTEDRAAPGELDRTRIVRHALAFVRS